jgi:hypothetical protein
MIDAFISFRTDPRSSCSFLTSQMVPQWGSGEGGFHLILEGEGAEGLSKG